MKFVPQSIPDIILIKPSVLDDERGYFMETFRQDLFEQFIGYNINFIQDNESESKKNVLRGLHFQTPPFTQAKLVRVVKGSVLDVAVDIRKSSPNFGKHVAINLSSKNKFQLFIPHGFAHGYIVLSEQAIFSYKVDNFYSPEHSEGIIFNDKVLAIDWKRPKENLLISNQDKTFSSFKNSKHLFD